MKSSLFCFLRFISCLALILLTQNSLAFLGNNSLLSNVQIKLSSNKILSHGIAISSKNKSKSNDAGIIKNHCGINSFWKKIKVINATSFRNEKIRKRIKFAFAAILATLVSQPKNVMAETHGPFIHEKSSFEPVIRKSPCMTMISSKLLSDSKGKRITIALSGGALVGTLFGSDIKALAKKRNKNKDKGEEVYQSLMNPPTTFDTDESTKSTKTIKAAIEELSVEAVKASEQKAFTMAANDLAEKWKEEDGKRAADALVKAKAEKKTEKNKIEAAKIEAEARIRAKLKAQKEQDVKRTADARAKKWKEEEEKKAADALAKAEAEMEAEKNKIEAKARDEAKLKDQREKGETNVVEASEISNEGVDLMKKSELSDKYAQLPLEERAYQILVDLGMVNVTADPDDPNYNSSHDNEWAPENIFENFNFEDYEEKPSSFSRLRKLYRRKF